ncbi:MAG TPA: envelope stress response membrane protein PspB [Halieaceae bacterium]|jgi:phage shock protein B|uniref:Envelope stress response membrane protein PspB n=1 Tax=Haliea salexigens TaxID=287487 RepID=A0A3C1KSV2_9GAMM|nr:MULTISPECIES: envelope stress response membrane protein PspB [Haliea]HAN29765.1 envelope stress response membrane protein PspB [Haliea salexigens]HAN67008.1 envelope stress response membrane protein PspB [Halieaceae bacterium]MAA86171.1 envelope stress response membrane protein PspB [Haliea sp.]MAD63478.1 envelope stress response membrane protein PspB [Haliea sp.]MAY93454.1 envelope stress response membrane protein PspB [Haliea sp.]|tara:strand:- start:72410 stop:72679 length:270 start_codon:yes stop_codon:yes gene_type:complete
MQFWQFMFVPTILFLVIVAPIWITMHYRSVNRSSQSLNAADRQDLEDLLATVDRLTERIGALETILDADHSTWREQSGRQPRKEEYNNE